MSAWGSQNFLYLECMDESTKKTPNTICRLFFKWPVNRLCSILFNRFYRLEIHTLMVGIFDPACELLPPWTKEQYLCTVAPLPSLWPPPPSPASQTKCTVYTDSVWLWGGGGGVYTLFLTRFRTYKIASPPQTKMTCKDDIKGLVSLKFLRPCLRVSPFSLAPPVLWRCERQVPDCERDGLLRSRPR